MSTEDAVEQTPEATSQARIGELCRHAAELIAVGGGMRRVRLQSGDTVIELEWPDAVASGAPPAAVIPVPAAAEHDDDLRHLCAPMVGTFYVAPEPGATPFIAVGDTIEKGQQVGILEAMKLMNPIEADTSGKVMDILVPDGTPVEYGQQLIAVAPLATD